MSLSRHLHPLLQMLTNSNNARLCPTLDLQRPSLIILLEVQHQTIHLNSFAPLYPPRTPQQHPRDLRRLRHHNTRMLLKRLVIPHPLAHLGLPRQ